MNTPLDPPLDTELPPGSAEVVARVRAALDEVAATTSSTATAGVGPGSGARMPSRWSTGQWVAAAACLLAVVIGGVLVLRPNDREPLRPSGTETTPPTVSAPSDSPMPYFLAAADLAPGPITENDPCCPGTDSVVSAWALDGDPGLGLLVAWTQPVYSSYLPELPAESTIRVTTETWIGTVSYGINAEERQALTDAIVPGSGLPWVLPVDGWEWIGFSTSTDEPAVSQRFGTVTLTFGVPMDDLVELAAASRVRPAEVVGERAWVFTLPNDRTVVIWREPTSGRWAGLDVPAALAERVDGLIAAIVPTSGGEPATSVPAPVDDQLVRVVSVSGDALPVFDSSSTSDPAVGLPIPTIQTSAGEFTVDGPTLFVFVAHWCPHCNAELPRLIEGLASNAFDGARVVLVSTAELPTSVNYPPGEWLASRGWTGEVLHDDAIHEDGYPGVLAEAFGASAWPYFVMVDREGVVTARTSGEREVVDVVELINTAAAGEAVGRLVIDAIDLDFMVLEGGGDHVATLKKGPILTFDRETGTPTIVGHRTTYGAPFLRLEELQIGDRLTFTTVDGTRTFEVTLVDRCDGDEPCPARDGDDLLLAAFGPEYTSNTSLTVHATEVFD